MVSKTKVGTNTNPKPKTKKQIEAAAPIIKPEDCPGAIIKWIAERDEKLLEKIEDVIEGLFETYFKKYTTMIFNNRIWIIVLSVFVGALWGIVVYHLYK
jgi:hypothetical protein